MYCVYDEQTLTLKLIQNQTLDESGVKASAETNRLEMLKHFVVVKL